MSTDNEQTTSFMWQGRKASISNEESQPDKDQCPYCNTVHDVESSKLAESGGTDSNITNLLGLEQAKIVCPNCGTTHDLIYGRGASRLQTQLAERESLLRADQEKSGGLDKALRIVQEQKAATANVNRLATELIEASMSSFHNPSPVNRIPEARQLYNDRLKELDTLRRNVALDNELSPSQKETLDEVLSSDQKTTKNKLAAFDTVFKKWWQFWK